MLEELVGTPFEEGGRDPEKGIDCLGVTLLCAALRGRPFPDPWEEFKKRWQEGERLSVYTAWEPPRDWMSIDPRLPALRDDVAIFTVVAGENVPGHIGYLIEDGLLMSAREATGVYTRQYARIADRVVALWRWCG